MRLRCRLRILLLISVIGLHVNTIAGQQHLPSAESIIRDHIDAIGGEMMLRSFQTCDIQSRVEAISTNYADGKMFLSASGDRWRYTFALGNNPKNWRICDGKWVWYQADGSEPVLYDIDEARTFKEIVPRVASALDWLDYDGAIEVVDKVTIRQVECYQLRFQPSRGLPLDRFFDVETKMLTRVRYASPTMGGDGDWYLSDYRDVSGVTLPFKREQYNKGEHLYDVIFERVAVETKLDESLFQRPREIDAPIALAESQLKQASDDRDR